MNSDQIPHPPEISQEQLEQCRASGDFCPILFEWYGYVGSVCNFIACIDSRSPAIRDIPTIHYHVLIGLLNRCSRLMLANVALSHKGLFGETTGIIDRCIFESVIKLTWLCRRDEESTFRQFLADGLKSELEFEQLIRANVDARSGDVLEIEERMLQSIDNHIASSGLARDEIAAESRLPNLSNMLEELGAYRLMYVVGQRMGSHHVHGTWPSLRLHYLEEFEGQLVPRDHDCATHDNQYVFVSMMVLDAVRAFVEFSFESAEERTTFISMLDAIEKEVQTINSEVVGRDFELVDNV